jgi:outer membrane protein OmpA-like peptidoglycan-associated protein
MKTFLTTTVLGALGALMLAGTAAASQDIVRSTNGNVVKNTHSNCVLSNFEGGAVECGDTDFASDMLSVYFDFDSAVLTPAAKAKLDVVASKLKADAMVKSVRIVGYADELGNNSYNQGLSQRRSDAVARYLSGMGVNVGGGLEIRGLGETSSHSQCKNVRGAALKACLWRDRRVEIELVK